MKVDKPMKKILIACFILLGTHHSNAQIKKTTYEVSARNMSLDAVDSYPQKIVEIERKDSVYEVILTTFAPYDDVDKREIALKDRYVGDYCYPDSVKAFLEPTFLTDHRVPRIRAVADSILDFKDSLSIQVISRFLQYTPRSIGYDNELAQQLDQGKCTTLDVNTILDRGKGTCSEYTNLFISLARAANIPCRMVVGYIYMPENQFEGSHAWAECYIKGYGWLAVDPQNGFCWYPSCAIKLFYGRDFVDCNIKTLPDMYPVKVKRLDRQHADP